MNNLNVITKSFVVLIVIILMAGVMIGWLLNEQYPVKLFGTDASEVQREEIIQAEIDRKNEANRFEKEKNNLKIEKERMWAEVMTSLVTYFGIGVCVIGCYVTVKVVNRNFQRGRFITWDRNVNVLDHDIYARRKAIAAARQRERDAIAKSRHLFQAEGLYANDGYHTEVSR